MKKPKKNKKQRKIYIPKDEKNMDGTHHKNKIAGADFFEYLIIILTFYLVVSFHILWFLVLIWLFIIRV